MTERPCSNPGCVVTGRHYHATDLPAYRPHAEGHEPGALAEWAAPPGDERLREAARRIADMSEERIRDYEQGLCFFCEHPMEKVPGPRGGLSGSRALRPAHLPGCSYIALRAALDREAGR